MKPCLSLIKLFACLILITSCQKKFENPEITRGNATDTFKIVVNGILFPVYDISVKKILNDVNVIARDITGFRRLSLTIPADVAPGSYPLDFSAITYFGTYNPDTSTLLVSDNGTLMIIENNLISKRMRAIFDFNARYTAGSTTFAQLSDGYFSIKYP